MPRKWGNDAVAGSFEELPALLVVITAISLFSVSLAHASVSWGGNDAREALQLDCRTFAELVRRSETLGASGRPGTFDHGRLANLSAGDFLREFNSTLLGFGYRVTVQCLDMETGNITLDLEILSPETSVGMETAAFHTCVNVDYGGRIGAARLIVVIWRPAE